MSITDKTFDKLTALEREKAEKKKIYEDSELIDAMGQESEIGAQKVVRQYVKDVEREEQKYTDEAMEILTGLIARGPQAYNDFLLAVTHRFLSQETYPKTFQVNVVANRIGIIVAIQGTKLYGAFKSTFMPQYDYMACKILAVRTGNTIAKMQGNYNKTPGGIFIADGEDMKKYGRNHES